MSVMCVGQKSGAPERARTRGTRLRAIRPDVALAATTPLANLLIAHGVLAVGDLAASDRPPAIIYVAAGCYLLGGPLILARRRWLWITGAVISALVILFYFSMYQHRPAVLLSPGGLVSKAAQLLLAVGPLSLIISDWRYPRGQA